MASFNNGHIKISRSIMEWGWYTDANTFRLFMHILLRANWKDGKFKGESVPRGTFVTSVNTLQRELRMSERAVRTALNHLIMTNEITRRVTPQYSVITVVNYDRYQTNDKQNDRQTSDERQTSDKQTSTNEERKNSKKGNKGNIKPPHRGWILADVRDPEWMRAHKPLDGWRVETVDGVIWAYKVKV